MDSLHSADITRQRRHRGRHRHRRHHHHQTPSSPIPDSRSFKSSTSPHAATNPYLFLLPAPLSDLAPSNLSRNTSETTQTPNFDSPCPVNFRHLQFNLPTTLPIPSHRPPHPHHHLPPIRPPHTALALAVNANPPKYVATSSGRLAPAV